MTFDQLAPIVSSQDSVNFPNSSAKELSQTKSYFWVILI